MNQQTEIGRLHTGELVYGRFGQNHNAITEDIMTFALSKISSQEGKDFIEETLVMETSGLTKCVIPSPTDEIVYAVRPGRKGFSKFVKDCLPQECNSLVIAIKKEGSGQHYFLVTAFWGYAFKEPYDQNATPQDNMFWRKAALIFNPDDIIAGSERATPPPIWDEVMALPIMK